jgi:hypothetical protein
MIFLILLIHDLDNPFAYDKKYSAENVSLYPISRLLTEIEILNKGTDIKNTIPGSGSEES